MAEALSRPLPLAVVILTLNEARFLPECLASVAGLGERVLVVDSGSSDGTVEIARQLGAEVVYRAFTGFAEQRNAALALVTQPWVLFLDADERLTRPLQQEIRRAIASAADDVVAFAIPRRNRVLGRELRGGGWWPDYQVRLMRVGRARYTPGREVHETVEVDGDVVRLREPLLHLNYDSWAEFQVKQRRYARMGAAMMQREGLLPRRRAYVGRPAREAWRRFVGLSGYRDGVLGFKLALSLAWYEFRMVGWARSRTTAKDEPPGSPRDDQPLAFHQVRSALLCHQCGYQRHMPEKCPNCGSRQIRQLGLGTEKLEELVKSAFPQARILRWDAETTAAKDAHEIILSHFSAHRADILIGTQMLAKGLELPLVALVGIVLAEVGLNLPDYRAAERTFQVLTQVSGRAGRGPLGGRVILQTYEPENYVIQAAAEQDFETFFARELEARRALEYPPFTRLVRLEYRHLSEEKCEQTAREMAALLRESAARLGQPQPNLIGPVPCYYRKTFGTFRWQIVLRSSDPLPLIRQLPLRDWRVEVDPPNLL